MGGVDEDVLAFEREVLRGVVAGVRRGVEDGERGLGDARKPFLNPTETDGSLSRVTVR